MRQAGGALIEWPRADGIELPALICRAVCACKLLTCAWCGCGSGTIVCCREVGGSGDALTLLKRLSDEATLVMPSEALSRRSDELRDNELLGEPGVADEPR